MLDNLQLVPGEAFSASEHLISKVIDKISDVTGWVAAPKGNKAYQLEAEEYLIEQIKQNSNMPILAKAACISNVRKVIREYQNQYNVLSTALKFLDNSADLDGVDDDWLSYFFDNAKNVSKEDMTVLWGQILAREINQPNRVPKALIYILSIIDYEDAMSFKKLANFSLETDGTYLPVIFISKKGIYESNGLNMGDIIRLQDTGLIQYNNLPYTISQSTENKITYFDTVIDVRGIEEICVGNVILSKTGQELMSVVADKRKIDGFAEFVSDTIVREMGGMIEDILAE